MSDAYATETGNAGRVVGRHRTRAHREGGPACDGPLLASTMAAGVVRLRCSRCGTTMHVELTEDPR